MYILNTPPVLFNMVVDGTLDGQTAQLFLEVAYQINPFFIKDHVIGPQIQQTVKTANTLFNIAKKIQQQHPKAGAEFFDYIKSLMERVGLIRTILICTMDSDILKIAANLSSINSPGEALRVKNILIATIEKNSLEISRNQKEHEMQFNKQK